MSESSDTESESPCLDDREIESPYLDDRNLNDKERLQDRLEWEGYTETRVKSDGNCQFRAIGHQFYEDKNSHDRVRKEIVKELKTHPQWYKQFVYDMQYKEYVKNMSRDSVWGDGTTLQAAASVYGVKIVVITSSKYTSSFVVLPKSQKEPDKVIHLSYLEGIHFNSIHLKQGTFTVKKNEEKEKEEKEEKREEKKWEMEANKEKRGKTEKNNTHKIRKQLHDLFDDMSLMPLEGEGEGEEEEEEEEEKLCRHQFHLADFM
ncbi:unnamed protein product [Microthlaspi erraticum]|uniref:OTU domain-containing protein n=1 Tax=Microthlaspi erraticum TaxID=1685480 RepID=A0A6D2KJC5_9BRAS|nr:unnamed protein product [Microthlaspi erraticum]